jgi:hypothetical protein
MISHTTERFRKLYGNLPNKSESRQGRRIGSSKAIHIILVYILSAFIRHDRFIQSALLKIIEP